MHTERASGGRAVYVFAHQDDEYGINSRIRFDIARGMRVTCIYLTDGGANVDPRRREAESRAVLSSYGVDAAQILFLGTSLGICDGQLHRHVVPACDALRAIIEPIADEISALYTLAWEGGHQDHDSTRAIVSYLASEFGLCDRAFEYGLYDGAGMRAFFRVMRAPRSTQLFCRRLPFSEALKSALQCWRYPSQRRTWLGLFPEAALRWIGSRREILGRLDVPRVLSRPHAGTLLYERLFHTSYDDVAAGLAPVLERITECR